MRLNCCIYNEGGLLISLDFNGDLFDAKSLIKKITPISMLYLRENRIGFIIAFYYSIWRNALQSKVGTARIPQQIL